MTSPFCRIGKGSVGGAEAVVQCAPVKQHLVGVGVQFLEVTVENPAVRLTVKFSEVRLHRVAVRSEQERVVVCEDKPSEI